MQDPQMPAEMPNVEAWFEGYSDHLQGDRYPFYSYLLEHEPLRYLDGGRFWAVSRYKDVNRILRDPLFVREYRNTLSRDQQQQLPEPPVEWKPVTELIENWMLYRDAPTHTRLRGLVSRAFTPKTIEQLKPKIRAVADLLAARMEEESQPELIASFAFPLPVIVIAELLGVPPEDRELFKEWSQTFAKVIASVDQSLEFGQEAGRVTQDISEYFRELIKKRRSQPREDLISGLLAEEQTDMLTEQELIATCVLLLVAGHETTVHLIGNCVFTLLNHHEQHHKLIQNPNLMASAVEEVLRFESPVQMTSCYASADYEIDGRIIRQGQSVSLMLAAANRDPLQFHCPNQFDIERSPNSHLAFSSGSHFCVGAPLARMEGEIALAILLERFPHMRLMDGSPNWCPSILFRGQKSMSLEL